MQRHAPLVLGALLLGAAAPAHAAGQEAEGTRLRYSFTRGEVYHIRMLETETQLEEDITESKETTTRTEKESVFALRVIDIDPGGTADIEIKLHYIRVEKRANGRDLPGMDSRRHQVQENPLSRIGAAIINKPYRFRLSPLGAVTDVRGLKELVARIMKEGAELVEDPNQREMMMRIFKNALTQFLNPSNVSKMLSEMFIPFPKKPLRKGGAWTNQLTLATDWFDVRYDRTFRLADRPDGDGAHRVTLQGKLDMISKLDGVEFEVESANASGVCRLDRRTGWMLESENTSRFRMKSYSTANGAKVHLGTTTTSTKITTQVDRKPAKVWEADGLLERALAGLRKGKTAEAIRDLTRAAEQNPRDACAFFLRCQARLGMSDQEGAEKDLKKSIELEPEYAPAYLMRAGFRSDQGNLDGAIEDYSTLIRLNPESSLAYGLRAEAYGNKQDFKGAAADLDKAIELEPDFTFAYLRRGIARLMLSRYKEAEQDFSHFIDKNPRDASGFALRADARQEQGRFKEAVADFNLAIQRDSSNPDYYNDRADARLCIGDTKGAVADRTRAIQLAPRRADFHLARGFAYRANLDLASADKDYARGLDLNPDFAWAYFHRGSLRFDQGKWEESLADMKKAMSLDPSVESYARLWIWLCQVRLDRAREADRALSAFVEKERKGGSEDWYVTIGEFLIGRISEEKLLLAASVEKPLQAREKRCEALYIVAARFYVRGDRANARKRFQASLDTGVKHFFETLSARAMLRRLLPREF